LMREAAMAFASANPSTFAALVGSGMLAASTAIDDSRPLDRQAAVAIGRSIAAGIAAKGGAELGDKTLLDVLVPALDELDGGASVADVHAFLERRVDEIASWRSKRGRAAWHQERSIGLKDPGAVAVAYALGFLIDNGLA
jgi:D-erythrulose 4-kinase